MSKRVGFRSGPQAPSAFIKLMFQSAIFGSNHLDRSIILHAQNLSDRTSAVNETDSLFIYVSYEAAATWWTNDERNNVARMEGKNLIPAGQTRVIWKSPRLPGGPWAIRADLPAQAKIDVRTALLALPTAAPEAWQELTDGKNQGLQEIAHAEYEPIIRMIKDTQRARRDVKVN